MLNIKDTGNYSKICCTCSIDSAMYYFRLNNGMRRNSTSSNQLFVLRKYRPSVTLYFEVFG